MMAATTSTTSATGDNNHYNIVANNKRNDPATPSLFQGDESLDEEDFDDIDIIATDDKCRNNDNNDNNDDGRGGLNALPPALASTSSSSSSGSGGSSSELHESSDEGTSGNDGRYYNQQNQPQQEPPNSYHQISSPIPTNTHHQNNNINNNNDNNNNIGKSITPLHNIPYVHGGYAAAAPLFITHSKFATILKRLLPGAYLELKDLLGKSATTTSSSSGGGYGNGEGGDWSGSNDLLQRYSLDNDLIIQSDENKNENGENELPYDWNNSSSRQQPRGKIKGSTTTQQQRGVTMTDPVKIMKWAENNPIVSAFGIWNSDNGRRTKKFMQGVVVVQNGDNVDKNGDGGDSGGGVEGGADKEGGERMNLLLRSLSSSAVDPSSAAATDQVEFVQHHDRGNSSVVEAVMTTPGGSSTNTPSDSTQQRLLRHRQRLNQQQQQQQQQSKQRQRKRDANNSSPLPPLPPPPSLASSSRNVSGSSYYSGSGGGGYSPPPPSSLPPGSKLLKGGGISGIGGVSSPRRKVPLPSDLPNTSNSGVLGYPSVDHSLLTRSRSLSFDSANHHLNHQRSTSLHLLPPVVENQLLPSSKQQQKQHYNKPALEWDIFLDPSLVRRVDMALHTVDTLEIQLRKIRMKRERLRQQKLKERRLNGSTTSLEDVDSDDDEEDFDLLQSHTAAQVEVDRLVAQLMRRTIIAHGSMSQLVLEATGWAPEYNFGRVVKCSREGTNLPSPKRRGGNNNKDLTPLSFTETLSWDEEEEQRDFEALLDHKMMGTDGGATGAAGSNTNSAKSGTHHSKGMFMEKWLSLFAKSLSLLVRSTANTSPSGDDTDDNNDIVKLSSSSSSVATRRKRAQDDMLVTKKEKKSATNKAEEEKGLTSYFSSFFFGSEKRSNSVNPEEDGDNDQEEDAANESYLTINDMFSPATTKKSTGILGGLSCGMSLCLGMDDDNERFICGASTGQTSNSVFPLNPHASHQMARDIQRIHDVLGEPLRLVLDLKSRRVPPRVWSRLIDNLRSRGLIVEGIGSFDMDELRVIGKGCSYPLTPILFFHSVGDLQRACHANEVKKGDTVYFNGGSLMWKRSSIMEAAECNACCGVGQMNDLDDDENENDFQSNAYGRTSSTATIATNTSARVLNASGKYSFQPYAYPRSALSDWERVMCKSTIEDYRRHFDLKIGVYVQEFSISAEALDELTVFVNEHGDLYDQGLAFGGVNGVAVKNISGDGYWNQRYMGRSWDFNARPSREMTPLKPEDHHLVQVAIQAGAWGQVGTIYEVNDEQPGALTVPPPREPCKPVHW